MPLAAEADEPAALLALVGFAAAIGRRGGGGGMAAAALVVSVSDIAIAAAAALADGKSLERRPPGLLV